MPSTEQVANLLYEVVPSSEQVATLRYGSKVNSIWYVPVEPFLPEPAREGL